MSNDFYIEFWEYAVEGYSQASSATPLLTGEPLHKLRVGVGGYSTGNSTAYPLDPATTHVKVLFSQDLAASSVRGSYLGGYISGYIISSLNPGSNGGLNFPALYPGLIMPISYLGSGAGSLLVLNIQSASPANAGIGYINASNGLTGPDPYGVNRYAPGNS